MGWALGVCVPLRPIGPRDRTTCYRCPSCGHSSWSVPMTARYGCRPLKQYLRIACMQLKSLNWKVISHTYVRVHLLFTTFKASIVYSLMRRPIAYQVYGLLSKTELSRIDEQFLSIGLILQPREHESTTSVEADVTCLCKTVSTLIPTVTL